MDAFFAVTEQVAPLAPESRAALARIIHRSHRPKGSVLVPPDSVCNHIFFLETGLARTYYYKDGRDVTDWLAVAGTFAFSLVSFLTRQPDRRTVELLEPATLGAVPYDELEALCARFHDVEHLARRLTTQGLVLMQQRFDDLHFASAAERYQRLLHQAPTLVQRVPLGIIASYLGVTPETLSRIRAQL